MNLSYYAIEMLHFREKPLLDKNNKAFRVLGADAKTVDSDGDGLTDYEETNGMRVAFPHAYVTTLPDNPDSDGDGLSDGEEMGSVIYDPVNQLLYHDFGLFLGWPGYDGRHYQYRSDPNDRDIDGDGLNDKQELELGLNPFRSSPYTLVESGIGFLCGHFCADDPKHENIPFLGGWLVSGFLGFGDIRDLPSTIIDGDWLDFGLTILAIVPLIGDAESTLSKIVRMASKSDDTMLEVFEFVAKSDKLKPLLVKAVDVVTGSRASQLINKGAKTDDIVHVAKNRGNFKEIHFITKDRLLKQTRWLEEGKLGSAAGSSTWS